VISVHQRYGRTDIIRLHYPAQPCYAYCAGKNLPSWRLRTSRDWYLIRLFRRWQQQNVVIAVIMNIQCYQSNSSTRDCRGGKRSHYRIFGESCLPRKCEYIRQRATGNICL